MPPKLSAKTVEGRVSKRDTVDITIQSLDLTRVFIQQQISGVGLNCLWRSVAASYYGSQNRWRELHRRARALYAAATSDTATLLGSPLQFARRELYETIAESASDFLPRLANGEWGDMDHVQIIADVLDVEVIAYTFDVTENGDLRWGMTARGNRQPPNRQVHIINYRSLLHWQVLTPTDIDAEDEDEINDLDWQLFIDPVHLRPTAPGDDGRIPRLPMGHARYNDHTLTAKDQGHVADDRSPETTEQLRAAAAEIKAKEAEVAAAKEKLAKEVAAVAAAAERKKAKEAAIAKEAKAQAEAEAKEEKARETKAIAAKERKAKEAKEAAAHEKKARDAKAEAVKEKEAKAKATVAAAKEKKNNAEAAATAVAKEKTRSAKAKAEARERNKAEAAKMQQEIEAAEEKKKIQAAKERDDRVKAADSRKAKAEKEKKKAEAKEKKGKAKAVDMKRKAGVTRKNKKSNAAKKKQAESNSKILAEMAKDVKAEREKRSDKKLAKKAIKKKATLAAIKLVPEESAGRLKRKRGGEATEQEASKKRK